MQKYTLSSHGKAGLIFSLVLCFIIAYWFFAFDGFDFYDDYAYSYFANQMAEGTFKAGENHFSHRIGTFAPLALLYRIFGLNDYITILWPLLCHLTAVSLVYFMLRKKDGEAAVAGSILSGLSFYSIFFCKELYPDTMVACFGMASASILFMWRSRKDSMLYFSSFLFVCFVFMGFLSKETALYFFPFYLVLFIHDMFRKINVRFWIASFLIGLVFILIYLLWYKIYMGNFFYRFQAIQDGHYEFAGSYYQKKFIEYIPRLTYEPFLMLLQTEMIIPFLIAVPAVFSLNLKDLRDLEKTKSFWTCLVFFILFMFWFCSTSIQFYNPISLQGRMLLMLVPPLCVLAGLGWKKIKESAYWNGVVVLLFFILTVFQSLFFSPKTALVYLLLTLLFSLIWFFRKYQFRYFSLLMLFLMMAVHPFYSMVKPTDTGYKSEKEMVREFLTNGERKNIVLVDPQFYSGHLYYYGFHANPHYDYVKFDLVNKERLLNADRYYVLINQHSWDLFHQLGVPYPAWVLYPPDDWKLISEKEKVRLYQAKNAESILKYY
jgi:hypothetical protein